MAIDKQILLDRMAGRWAEFYSKYTQFQNNKSEWKRGACPLHAGDGPNFVVNVQTGEWRCHSKCDAGGDVFDFIQRLNGCEFHTALLELAEWLNMPEDNAGGKNSGNTGSSVKPRIDATYDYTDEPGNLLFQVVRYKPKEFRQRRPDGNGGWIYNLDGVRRVLYRLPEVLAAIRDGKTIYVVEGEKDADRLFSIGLTATCNPMGAGKWDPAYNEALRGADVVLIPDNDKPGREHMDKVGLALNGIARSIRLLELPGVGDKGDVSDWLDAGGTVEAFTAMANNAPVFVPKLQNEAIVMSTSTTLKPLFPVPDQAVYYGLLGEIVQTLLPHTEADPMAILGSLLVGFGNVIGRSAYYSIEATRHYTNLNAVVVGKSAVGRKGTALDHALNVLRKTDAEWDSTRILSGLSTGEGLIYAVRDDPAVTDKRLLITETEFAKVLKVIQRDGNSLSAIIRQAWDSGTLRVMTKQEQKATGAHISIIGHITKDELMRELNDTEIANGFANRFLWLFSQRSKHLPEGGNLHTVYMTPLYVRLTEAVNFARITAEITRNDDARAIWREVYPQLTREESGLFGSIIARGAPTVIRLSMIYALLDMSPIIRPAHLLAALAVWKYSEDSIRYIFGDTLGDPIADKIIAALRCRPEGMTQTDVRDLFGRNVKASKYLSCLEILVSQEIIRAHTEETGGKPATRWFAI